MFLFFCKKLIDLKWQGLLPFPTHHNKKTSDLLRLTREISLVGKNKGHFNVTQLNWQSYPDVAHYYISRFPWADCDCHSLLSLCTPLYTYTKCIVVVGNTNCTNLQEQNMKEVTIKQVIVFKRKTSQKVSKLER